FQASSGTAPYTFSARDLPNGLSLDGASGALSGATTPPGHYEFTVGVEDNSGNLCHAEQIYRLDVCPGNPILSPQATGSSTTWALPEAIRNDAYEAHVLAICGTAPYRVDSPTGLPAGLQLSLSGADVRLEGRFAQTGDHVFDLRVTDAAGKTSSATY